MCTACVSRTATELTAENGVAVQGELFTTSMTACQQRLPKRLRARKHLLGAPCCCLFVHKRWRRRTHGQKQKSREAERKAQTTRCARATARSPWRRDTCKRKHLRIHSL